MNKELIGPLVLWAYLISNSFQEKHIFNKGLSNDFLFKISIEIQEAFVQ